MHYTYEEIKNSDGAKKSWWETIFLNKFVYRLTWIAANYTNFKPNQITLASFALGMLSAYFFLKGTWYYMVIGAFMFESCFIMDCIDGRLARLKRLESIFGAYLDITADITKFFIIVLCLIYGQYLQTKDISMFIYGYIFVFFEIMSITGIYGINSGNSITEGDTNTIISDRFPFIAKLKKHIDPENRLSFVPLSAIEAETIALFIAPIFNEIKLGIILGIMILFINILISVLFNFIIKNKLDCFRIRSKWMNNKNEDREK